MKNIDWKLCLVADVGFAGRHDLSGLILESVRAGAGIVQLRAKNLDTIEFLELGFQAVKIVHPRGIPLIINDRIDIAQACGADGIHLGQSDMPLEQARKILGPDCIIGISVNTRDQALAAQSGGADYLGAGPIFPTGSKQDLDPIMGLDSLKKMREAVSLPILAIGGISADNANRVIAAGADGIAVISAIMGAEDPGAATRHLLKRMSMDPA